jgi:hypothetical protein
MALRSAENSDNEMLGVDDADDVVEDDVALALALELALELELELELPHPAATADTTTSKAHAFNRLKLITARSSQLARNLTKVSAGQHRPRNTQCQTVTAPSTVVNRA